MKKRSVLSRVRITITALTGAFIIATLVAAPSPPRDDEQNKQQFFSLPAASTSRAAAGVKDKVVFSADGKIYVVNDDGTELKRLTKDDSYNTTPAWSPDGSKIAFASNRDSLNSNLDIFVMNADGSDVTALTNSSLSESEPTWSPDGRRIAFTRGYDPTDVFTINLGSCANSNIYVVDVDGGGETALLPTGMSGTDPSWSPDGRQLAFSAKLDSGLYVIHVKNLETGKITNPTSQLGHEGEPAWSPDGSKIAFVSGFAWVQTECGIMVGGLGAGSYVGPDVYVVNADGQNETRVTFGELNSEPAWAPGGDRIAFTSFQNGTLRIYATEITSHLRVEDMLLSGSLDGASSPAW